MRRTILAALLTLQVATSAFAQSSTLTLTPCAERVVDTAALEAQLRIELAATPEVLVAIDCGASPGELALHVVRKQPPGQSDATFSLVDVIAAHRPRTLALAVAELVRQVESRPPQREAPAAPPSVASTAIPGSTPNAKRARNAQTIRLTKGLSIGFGVGAIVLAVIGGPLLSIGLHTAPERPVGLIAPGGTLVALSGLSVVGMSASLGVLGYELHF